ncbi:MAG: hypothetical protein QXD03_03725 [Candidatus Anstonellales archaeon]
MALSFKNTIVKATRQAKTKRAGSRIAIKIARENNDPLYDRYVMARKKYLELKKRLIEKYKSKARRAIGRSF